MEAQQHEALNYDALAQWQQLRHDQRAGEREAARALSNLHANCFIAGFVLVLALALNSFGSSGPASSAGEVIDGISFAGELKQGRTALRFVGGGTRSKAKIVKVYAVALYIEEAAAHGLLGGFTGGEPGFFEALIHGTFAQSFVLEFHRAVDSAAVAGGISDALASRLPAKSVTKFRAAVLQVAGDSVSRGSKLTFACKGGAMTLSSAGKSASLKDKGVCPALWDVYLGKSPVSPPAKAGVGAGFKAHFR